MSAPLDLKSKEEKDAELDRRIAALRRKNEALIRRYQEIEEDRRRAEQEGVAVTGVRRPRSAEGDGPERRRREPDSPTLTEKRVVSSERRPPTLSRTPRGVPRVRGSPRGRPSQRAECPPEQPVWEGADPEGPGSGRRGRAGRGRRPQGRGGPAGDVGPDRRSKEWEERRRQNIEKMNEEMEKIAEYERSRRDGLQEKNPVRNFLDDPRRSGPFAESDRREGSRRHIRNWGGSDFDKVKTGMELGKEHSPPARGGGSRRRGAALDMTLSMTGRERAEYIRWKQEREQIDQERLARHRQPTGEWRREWDAEKADATSKEGSRPGASTGSSQDDSRRPPRLPTFAEFLPEQRPERRRRGRGRGRTRGTSKPYSMHDNRWEKEEPDHGGAAPGAVEDKAENAPARQQMMEPALRCLAPEEEGEEEEEDQWEDVSEGEEEGADAAEGSGSQDSMEEEEPGPSSTSQGEEPQQPSQDGQLSLVMPAPHAETPSTEGKPLTPFSPVEGYHPVSDWGEAMELSSPWTDGTKREAPPANAGLHSSDSLTEQAAPQASLTDVPPASESEEPLAVEAEATQELRVSGTEAAPTPDVQQEPPEA